MLTSFGPIDDKPRTEVLKRRIRFIVGFTIIYNLTEAVVALVAGREASSGALIGFGIDSAVEVTSALAVAWQFSRPDPQRWEKPTLRVIALAFFGLALYVGTDAAIALRTGSHTEHSTIGIALTALSLIIMPIISYAERRAGEEIGSATAIADSKQTLMCCYLSAAVFLGLVLNSAFGWWWADAIAALVISGLAIREGIEAWHGDSCALSAGRALDGSPEAGCTDQCC